jgi:hypothetical protein
MPMMDERPAGQPTLDRLIERLERDFAKFTTDVALIQAEQVHLRELVNSKFSEVTSAVTRIEVGLDAIRNLVQTSTTDVAASPLGRSLTEDIIQVTRQAAAAQAIAERVEKRLTYAAGGLAVLIFAAGILGPLIAKSLFGLM